MRRTPSILLMAVLVLVVSLPAAAVNVAKEESAWPCDVNWTTGDFVLTDCEIVNIEYDNGGYTITLQGQVPADQLAAFQASGVTDYRTTCWANYLFVVQDGDEPVTVPSVRHFTPDGVMTEHCNALFTDTREHPFELDAEWMAFEGITEGCNAEGTLFCPEGLVTRGQMAAFLSRAFDLPAAGPSPFTDTVGSIFEADIAKVAAAGITQGCNAEGTLFCSDGLVTRGQMAAFLSRALNLPDGAVNTFVDDDGSIFEADIAKVAQAGITQGCTADGTRFCPNDFVTRGAMAAFLYRALG